MFYNKVMDRTASFYSRPSYEGGAGPIFTGARRQRGGSVFGAVKSIVAPLLSGVGKSLKKNALNNAFGLATDVVGDIFTGKNIKSSLIGRAKQRGLKTLKDTFSDVRGMPLRRKQKVVKRMKKRVLGRKQSGSGRKRRKSTKPSRKRPASRKSSSKAKRRRLNY